MHLIVSRGSIYWKEFWCKIALRPRAYNLQKYWVFKQAPRIIRAATSLVCLWLSLLNLMREWEFAQSPKCTISLISEYGIVRPGWNHFPFPELSNVRANIKHSRAPTLYSRMASWSAHAWLHIQGVLKGIVRVAFIWRSRHQACYLYTISPIRLAGR